MLAQRRLNKPEAQASLFEVSDSLACASGLYEEESGAAQRANSLRVSKECIKEYSMRVLPEGVDEYESAFSRESCLGGYEGFYTSTIG